MMRISKGSLKALRKQRGEGASSAEGGAHTGELLAGVVIAGRYEVRSVIGRGPFGLVYDALDRELESEVAVKVLRPGLVAEAADRERFEAAVRQARRLTQAHLVRLFDSGFHEEQPFVVMQRLEGLSLAKLRSLRDAEQGPYRREELEALLPQLTSGLQACHRTTFHGDLKPENIILQPERLKITDIFLFEALPHAAFASAASQSAYASPEVQEDRHAADLRSDIYSLGVILAELLGGVSLEAGAFVGPSTRNAAVPEAVDAVLAQATAADPARRFASVEELTEALWQAWAEPETLLTAPAVLALEAETPALEVGAESALVSGEHVVISADDILEVEEVEEVGDAPAQGAVNPLDIPTAMDIGEEIEAEAIEEIEAEEIEAEEIEELPEGLVLSEIPADEAEAEEADEKTQTTPIQDLLETTEVPREEEAAAPAAASPRVEGPAPVASRSRKEAGPKERKKKKSFMRPVESKGPREEPAAGETAVKAPPREPEAGKASSGVAAQARAEGRSLETERVRTLPRTKERGEAVRTTRNNTLIAVVVIFVIVLGVIGVMAFRDRDKGPQTVAGFGSKGASAPAASALAPATSPPATAAPATAAAVTAPPASLASAEVDAGPAEVDAGGSLASAPVASAEPVASVASAPPATAAPVASAAPPVTAAAPSGSVQVTAVKPPAEASGKPPAEASGKGAGKEPVDAVAAKGSEKAAPTTPGEPRCPGSMATIKNKDNKFPPYCIDRYEHPGGGARPTTGVSWHGADSACKAQGKRLCAIQEWQRACGAKYPWGAKWDPNKCVTEDEDELERSVQATGSMKTCRNGWGLFDMVGNVAEWVQEQRVVGGDATSGEKSASCYYATNKAAGSGSPLVGFRCCADPTFE